DARIAAVDCVARSFLLRADAHRAQLQQLEVDTALADAYLAVEHGPAVLELDRDGREPEQRTRRSEHETGAGDVERAVHGSQHAPFASASSAGRLERNSSRIPTKTPIA